MYNRFGDPGDPAEGGYLEITSIKVDREEVLSLLNSDLFDEIQEKADELGWAENEEDYIPESDD